MPFQRWSIAMTNNAERKGFSCVEQLSELCRGLGIPPTAAIQPPSIFYAIGKAIADQARARASGVPNNEPPTDVNNAANMAIKPLPAIGSIWMYKKNPDRLYEVIHVANVAHRHEAHPPHIVYRTLRFPSHIWTRKVDCFLKSFDHVRNCETGPKSASVPVERLEALADSWREFGIAAGGCECCCCELEQLITEYK
jgi:hypothetical protein